MDDWLQTFRRTTLPPFSWSSCPRRIPVLLGLLDHEHKDTKIFRNVGNLSQNNTASLHWSIGGPHSQFSWSSCPRRISVLLGLLDHEYKDIKIFRNVEKLSQNNTAPYPYKTWTHRNNAVRVWNLVIYFTSLERIVTVNVNRRCYCSSVSNCECQQTLL